MKEVDKRKMNIEQQEKKSMNKTTKNLNKDKDNVVKMLNGNEIKVKVKKIFYNFANFSEIDNEYYISHLTVNKLLKWLISKEPKLVNEMDILFKKSAQNSNRLNCEQFLNFLVKLVQKRKKEEFKEDKLQTLNNFFIEFFNNYNIMIQKEENANYVLPYQSIENLLEYKPDDKQKMVIKKITPTLYEIYIKFFNNSVSVDKSKKTDLNNLIAFTREFEIYPYIISKAQLVSYYYIIIESNCNSTFSGHDSPSEELKTNSFSFENFCLMFIHLSIISYEKNMQFENDKTEDNINNQYIELMKLLLFLETIEKSKGMKNFIRKFYCSSMHKLSFIPDKKTLNEIFGKTEEESKVSNNIPTSSEEIEIDNLYGNLNDSEINKLMHSNYSSLTQTFIHFCLLSSKLNYNQMSVTGYMRFLKNSKLVKNNQTNMKIETLKENEKKTYDKRDEFKNVINQLNNSTKKYLNANNESISTKKENDNADREKSNIPKLNRHLTKKALINDEIGKINESQINIIFSKVAGKTQRMNFYLFLKSFEFLAVYCFPKINPQEALKKLLISNIIPNLINDSITSQNFNENNELAIIQVAFSKLYSPEVKFFIKKFSSFLVTYYPYYCDTKNNMNFSNFFSFYKDFGLFPEVVNLIQLKNLFYFMSKYDILSSQQITNSKRLNINEDYIIFSNLAESIAICAILYEIEENYSDIDRLIYIAEKMNQSNGMSKCQSESGRTFAKGKSLEMFLADCKREFPEYYEYKKNYTSSWRLKRRQVEENSFNFDDIYGEKQTE